MGKRLLSGLHEILFEECYVVRFQQVVIKTVYADSSVINCLQHGKQQHWLSNRLEAGTLHWRLMNVHELVFKVGKCLIVVVEL